MLQCSAVSCAAGRLPALLIRGLPPPLIFFITSDGPIRCDPRCHAAGSVLLALAPRFFFSACCRAESQKRNNARLCLLRLAADMTLHNCSIPHHRARSPSPREFLPVLCPCSLVFGGSILPASSYRGLPTTCTPVRRRDSLEPLKQRVDWIRTAARARIACRNAKPAPSRMASCDKSVP